MRKLLIALVLLAAPVQAQTSLLEPLTKLRASYPPRMTPEQVGELLNRVAWEHRADGWGLLRKGSGTRCPVPHGGEASCDILIHGPSVTHFDVLADAEGVATPVWRDVGPCVLGPGSGCAMANFLAPVAPSDSPQPIPEPPVHSPQPIDLSPVYAQIDWLKAAIESQRTEIADLREYAGTLRDLIHGQTQATETLALRMQLLESRPIFTGCRTSWFGMRLSCSLVP